MSQPRGMTGMEKALFFACIMALLPIAILSGVALLCMPWRWKMEREG
ncbi:MAG: hypothetical protein K9N51_02365 [Candidatus Pacebacteria bacterium]|nr:hypothetical protein [Candidatus Paceibacterota bacterium]